ncbi:MAG: choice-of-anchor D domain-containing protein [Candidatus Latescibacterota bacterium]|nr:choice-of-anchor D domain-containing protein [Candidatus Latescibacterota bacterium]
MRTELLGLVALSLFFQLYASDANAVNSAPVLNNSGTMSLTGINEDDTNPAGITIADLLATAGNPITDADASDNEGVAVIAVVNTNGAWQFSTNGGASWTNFGTPTTSAARLLGADNANNKVRFVPLLNFNGAVDPGITFRAWDQTTGANGNTADISGGGATGGSTAYSTATETAAIAVAAINDAPLLDNSGTMSLTGISEDETNSSGNTIAALLATAGNPITDADATDNEGIAVISVDNANGAWQFSTNGGASWTNFGSPTTSAARLLGANNVNNKVRFVPAASFTGTVNLGIMFRAWDQTTGTNGNTADISGGGATGGSTAYSTATETASIDVNSAPVLDNSGTMSLTTINEDSNPSGNTIAALLATAGNPITDADATDNEGIAVIAVVNTNGAWQFSTNGGASWANFGSPTTSAARLLGANSANNKVRFVPSLNYNGTVDPGITFRAWDQTTGANGSTANVSTTGGTTAYSTATETASIVVTPVNDRPVVANLEGDVQVFHMGDPPTAITATVTISDVDDTDLEGATVQITSNLENSEDVLAFVNTPEITGSFNAATGLLTLTGTSSVANYRAALRSVTYHNTNVVNPSSETRTVTFTVNDGELTSHARTRITDVDDTFRENDAPILIGGTMSLTGISEDETNSSGNTIAAILATAGNPITDIDDLAIEGIAVIAVDNTNGAWQFSTDGGASWTNFGTLTPPNARLLGADSANNKIRFVPAASFTGTVNPGITFRAWDQSTDTNGNQIIIGATGGTTAYSTATAAASIAVNSAPVLSNSGTMSLPQINEDATNPTGIDIAALLFTAGNPITDVDATDNEGIAVIAVDNTNGAWQFSTNNGASWTDFGTVASSAARLLAADNVNNKVRFVPGLNFNGTVSITFRAWDQTTGTSASTANIIATGGTTAYSTSSRTASVVVAAVNDAPVHTVPGPQVIGQDVSLTFSTGNANLISVADVDAGGSSLQVTLTIVNGTATLNGVSGLVFASGDGTSDAMMVFTGTLTAINTALNGMFFRPIPPPAFNASASVQIQTHDQGNTGSGGGLTDDDTIGITVIPSHITPNPIAFGNVMVGVAKVLTVSVINTGTSTLTISNIASDDAQFVPSPTSLSVAGGLSAPFEVTFTPSSGGDRLGTLTLIATGNVLSPANISMTGFGTIHVPRGLNFGTVGLKNVKQVNSNLLNETGASVNITSIASSNPQFTILNPLPFTIANTATAVLTVQYLPTQEGTTLGTLTISYNPDVEIPVSGCGNWCDKESSVEDPMKKDDRTSVTVPFGGEVYLLMLVLGYGIYALSRRRH